MGLEIAVSAEIYSLLSNSSQFNRGYLLFHENQCENIIETKPGTKLICLSEFYSILAPRILENFLAVPYINISDKERATAEAHEWVMAERKIGITAVKGYCFAGTIPEFFIFERYNWGITSKQIKPRVMHEKQKAS